LKESSSMPSWLSAEVRHSSCRSISSCSSGNEVVAVVGSRRRRGAPLVPAMAVEVR
jgi:hypothetical protein